MDIWNILGIIAILCLLASFKIGRNAIWGTLTVGAIGGLIYCLFSDFSSFKKILIVSVFIGLFFELLGRLANAIRMQRIKATIKKQVEKEVRDKYDL